MNIKNLVLGIGIVVVFALVLWQGIEAFYPSPKYDDFCSVNRFDYPKIIPSGIQCASSQQLQAQEQQCYQDKGQPVYEYDDNGCQISIKECDYCNKEYESARDAHSKIVFVISIIVAFIAIIFGYAILSIEPVGSALLGSGIWAIFYGTLINWRNFTEIWRFLLLLIALILLILIAYRLNSQKKKSFWQKIGLKK
ncbi:hypothetical protein J4402_03025 [Candidatus Pacearchaeota archaeon]|nr:hypothetical protein [Candidatus Pacearchaeota archaeon]